MDRETRGFVVHRPDGTPDTAEDAAGRGYSTFATARDVARMLGSGARVSAYGPTDPFDPFGVRRGFAWAMVFVA